MDLSRRQPFTLILRPIRPLILWAATLPAMVQACPVCDTGTGQQVRAGIFGDDFWLTLLAVIAPFPVLLLAIAVYYFGLPTLWKHSRK